MAKSSIPLLTKQIGHDFLPLREGVSRPVPVMFVIVPIVFFLALATALIGIPSFLFLIDRSKNTHAALLVEQHELRAEVERLRKQDEALKEARDRALRLGEWLNRHPSIAGSMGVLVNRLPGQPVLTSLGLSHLDTSLRLSLSTTSDADMPATAVQDAYRFVGERYNITPRQFPQTTKQLGVQYDAIFFFD
jgi:hypothetical protein